VPEQARSLLFPSGGPLPVEVVLSCRPWAPALILLLSWSATAHGAADQWVVAVGGADQAHTLFGRAKREHLLIRCLANGLRGAPPGWDRCYVIEAPQLSAWADSLRVRGARFEEDAWFEPLAMDTPSTGGFFDRSHASFVPDDPELVAGRQWGLWDAS